MSKGASNPIPPRLQALTASLRVSPGTEVHLPADFNPASTHGFPNKAAAKRTLEEVIELLGEYQTRLAAEARHGVVVVIQGIDASGKDGVIKHVMTGVNPAGVNVHSFKVPSAEELSHDYLWRYQKQLPPRGKIAIFNRSHYEEVLVVRVHPEHLDRQMLPSPGNRHNVWAQRYREINDWERYLAVNGIRMVKIFLNLSKDEQRKRFLRRIDTPSKNWKFSVADVQERASWDDYQRAFAEMLTNTSSDVAPWHVVPADHKWFTRLAVASILVDELMRLDPAFPTPSKEASEALAAARKGLLREKARSRGQPPQDLCA